MNSRFLQTIAAALLVAASAAAQGNPDSSGDGLVHGDYFVRELLMTGNPNGSVTAAVSVTGTATFDGKGNYTFKGQSQSLASGSNNSVSLSGTYNVAGNGFFRMQSLADTTDVDFGGVSAVGPWAFVASATENANVTLMIGIPAGSSVTNASFKGSYTAGAIDFPGANINSVRQATFSLSPDGAGNLSNVALSGAAADQGGIALNQTASAVTYSLSGEGSGTINFGGSGTQIVNGSKNLYISADGNIILGGSPTGYDMMVAIRSLSGSASNSTANNEYYMGGFENCVAGAHCSSQGEPTAIDAYYGSGNATGSGLTLYHNRVTWLIFLQLDYTFDSHYTVSANGTVPVANADIPYSYAYGVPAANGAAQAFIATGDAVGSGFYSLTLGLSMQSFSGSGVYIEPNGVVNAATFSPITNPIAPGEWITIYGTGLPATASSATSLPLPTTLGNVSVTINGTPAPLDFVGPAFGNESQIVALVPNELNPDTTSYATIQVTYNKVASNQVTVFTQNTAPGVFANPVAVGAALAQHGANYGLISPGSPATAGETIIVYAGGLGATTPSVADGAPAPSTSPLATVNDGALSVDFNGDLATSIPFAGLTPTLAGLYQIDLPVPSGVAGDINGNVYVNVQTTDGYSSQSTISIAGVSSSAAKTPAAQMKLTRPAGRARKDDAHALSRHATR